MTEHIYKTNMNVAIVTDASSIRSLCIKEQWYTDGTIRAYDNLLSFVDNNKILDENNLDFIAWDIYNHSTNFDYSYSGEENVENIKYIILNNAARIVHFC